MKDARFLFKKKKSDGFIVIRGRFSRCFKYAFPGGVELLLCNSRGM